MKTISIDIETHSGYDLSKCGVYKYVQADDFDILLFGYSADNAPVQVIDLAQGEKIPEDILDALTDESVIKWAFNASFERVCLSEWLRRNYHERFRSYSLEEDSVRDYLDPSSWRCSMVWSAYMSLPLSLAGAGAVLGLDEQKMSEGKDLIRYFCVPCKPTAANGGRTRNLPCHAPDKWETFKAYNKRDVEVEMSIQQKLAKFPVPDFVWDEYHLSEEINDRGIALDMDVVRNAIKIDALTKDKLTAEMRRLTDLDNPNSVTQFTDWLLNRGVSTECLDKKAVRTLLKEVPDDISEVLRLRQQTSKTSVRKYDSSIKSTCILPIIDHPCIKISLMRL